MADFGKRYTFKRFGQALESLGLRVVFRVMRALPVDAASAVGGWLGGTFGPMIPRSEVARHNLRRAFPEKSDRERRDIVRGMWSNLGRTAFEYPHLDLIQPKHDSERVEIIGEEHLRALREDGRSALMFSGHFANWELLGPAAAALGIDLNQFYRRPNNPFLDWLFAARRSGNGEMLPKGRKGAKRALELLRRGAPLAMLVDQKMNDGIPVAFFGRDAMTAPALAQMALHFGCPILPTRIELLEGARFRITIQPPMTLLRSGDPKTDVRAAMLQVNGLLETWIRACPEQWLWLHRRWPVESVEAAG